MPDVSQAEKIFHSMMDKDYCSQWMGISPVVIKEGYCKIRMQVKKEMLNGFGLLHGGIAYTFADSAFAFASNSYGRVAVSIQGSMTFSASAKIDDILVAEATALHVGYKTADFDVNVYQEATKDILYRFRGTVYRKKEEHLKENNE